MRGSPAPPVHAPATLLTSLASPQLPPSHPTTTMGPPQGGSTCHGDEWYACAAPTYVPNPSKYSQQFLLHSTFVRTATSDVSPLREGRSRLGRINLPEFAPRGSCVLPLRMTAAGSSLPSRKPL